MKTYTNNGSKDGNKSYLVVNGKRVYTGQEFKADASDVAVLSENFNINTKGSKPAEKKAEEIKAVESVQPKPESFSGSKTLKNTNSDEGVK